jgi:hypothetical protein
VKLQTIVVALKGFRTSKSLNRVSSLQSRMSMTQFRRLNVEMETKNAFPGFSGSIGSSRSERTDIVSRFKLQALLTHDFRCTEKKR